MNSVITLLFGITGRYYTIWGIDSGVLSRRARHTPLALLNLSSRSMIYPRGKHTLLAPAKFGFVSVCGGRLASQIPLFCSSLFYRPNERHYRIILPPNTHLRDSELVGGNQLVLFCVRLFFTTDERDLVLLRLLYSERHVLSIPRASGFL